MSRRRLFLLEKQLKLVTRNVNYFYEKCLDFYYACIFKSPKWNEIISEFLFYALLFTNICTMNTLKKNLVKMQAHENVNDPFERISPHCIVKTFIVDI